MRQIHTQPSCKTCHSASLVGWANGSSKEIVSDTVFDKQELVSLSHSCIFILFWNYLTTCIFRVVEAETISEESNEEWLAWLGERS